MKVYIVEAMIKDNSTIRGYSGKMFYSGNELNEATRIKEELEQDNIHQNVVLLEYDV